MSKLRRAHHNHRCLSLTMLLFCTRSINGHLLFLLLFPQGSILGTILAISNTLLDSTLFILIHVLAIFITFTVQ